MLSGREKKLFPLRSKYSKEDKQPMSLVPSTQDLLAGNKIQTTSIHGYEAV